MAARPKVRQKLKCVMYQNAKQLKTTKKDEEETQEDYEEIGTPTIQKFQNKIEKIKEQKNKYVDFDDRKHSKPYAKDEQYKTCVPKQNLKLQDPTLPVRQHVTLKWKIITVICVILCVGLTAGLVTVLVIVTPCPSNTCLNVTPCTPNPCLNGEYCSIVESGYKCTCPLPLGGKRCEAQNLSRECDDIQSTVSGVYTIYPDGIKPVSVYCIMADNEKWTVIQRRVNGSVEFYRTWAEYKAGFGSANGEYWLGNENIHLISTSSAHTLAIYMEDFEAAFKYANYSIFFIGDEHRKYQLTVVGFNASAGVGDSLSYHSGRPFSTKDNNNDGFDCSVISRGAWWYYRCSFSNLNGPYHGGQGQNDKTLQWRNWRPYYSLKKTIMMVRRVSFV